MEEHPSKRDSLDEELDRFWDIDALLPRKKTFPRSEKTDTASLEIPPRREPMGNGGEVREQPIPPRDAAKTVVHSVSAVNEKPIHHYVYPHTAQELAKAPKPDDEYEPDCALIHRVKIYRWKSSYQYYEDFVKTAEKLQTVHGAPCQPVKFFSYVPQYSQMTRGQFGWYLWFRECVRREEYPETDYSYILLYAYEIINLSDRLDPAEGQRRLLGLWLNYRATYRQLDSYFPEWICDYSLIHHLPPPSELGFDARSALMQRCALKEFYVGGDSADGYLQALLVFCSNYDYKKSKFCTEENRPLFDRVMTEVQRTVTDRLSAEGKLFSASGMEDSKLTRDAYSGALCSYRMKRKLEISYCSFSRSHELRFLITDILKYTENKLRTHLGVRSKLTVYALPGNIRELIDGCTAAILPQKTVAERIRRQEDDAAYAHFYDLPKTPLSLSHAAEIERDSWDTTQRLVDAFENGEETEEVLPLPLCESKNSEEMLCVPQEENLADENRLLKALLPYRVFLKAVLTEDAAGQRQAATALGKMPDAVADEINELAADDLGDILLEDIGTCYAVIEDYKALLDGLL